MVDNEKEKTLIYKLFNDYWSLANEIKFYSDRFVCSVDFTSLWQEGRF